MSDNEFHVTKLPWVRQRKHPTERCDGYRRSQMPSKALWNRDGTRADPALKERYRCKHRGHYRFNALSQRRDDWLVAATTGVYCWQHLWQEIYHPREYNRAERWVTRHYPELLESRS